MGLFQIRKKEKAPEQQPQQVPPPPMPQPITPVDEVTRLRQQGLSNSQIIETLQRNGYKTHQVFDALNQAEIGRTGDQIPGAPYFDQQTPQEIQPQQPQQAYQEYEPAQPQQTQSYEEKIEEVAEAIIEEKWNDLLKDINKIVDWKNTMEANIKALEQRQQDLKQSFDTLQKAVLSKINDYDQNVTNVNSELKALEKVFQKLLPTFTENVNELSRAVKDLKKK
ncbi:hypothetical protein HY640_03005 [Candidatus Woesearchaeota archaeon]|nr:hypothetical protein [Candidatus Woesearchaeota archaeon]